MYSHYIYVRQNWRTTTKRNIIASWYERILKECSRHYILIKGSDQLIISLHHNKWGKLNAATSLLGGKSKKSAIKLNLNIVVI